MRVGATRQRVQAGGQAANATVVAGHDPRPARHPPLPPVRLRRSVAPPVFPHARAPHRPLCHEKGPRGGSRRGLRAAARGRRPPVRRPTAERRASRGPAYRCRQPPARGGRFRQWLGEGGGGRRGPPVTISCRGGMAQRQGPLLAYRRGTRGQAARGGAPPPRGGTAMTWATVATDRALAEMLGTGSVRGLAGVCIGCT